MLLCGDTLFSLGCGRLLEGTAAEMFRSLRALDALPGETLVCCGHEYTESNARFALSVDGGNAALRAMAEAAAALQARRQAHRADDPGAGARGEPVPARAGRRAAGGNCGGRRTASAERAERNGAVRADCSAAGHWSRKAEASAVARGPDERTERDTTDPHASHPELLRVNPLSKMPALLLDDGRALYDSPVRSP